MPGPVFPGTNSLEAKPNPNHGPRLNSFPWLERFSPRVNTKPNLAGTCSTIASHKCGAEKTLHFTWPRLKFDRREMRMMNDVTGTYLLYRARHQYPVPSTTHGWVPWASGLQTPHSKGKRRE